QSLRWCGGRRPGTDLMTGTRLRRGRIDVLGSWPIIASRDMKASSRVWCSRLAGVRPRGGNMNRTGLALVSAVAGVAIAVFTASAMAGVTSGGDTADRPAPERPLNAAAPSAPSPDRTQLLASFLAETNRVRRDQGLRELASSSDLDSVAQAHAEDMIGRG